MTTSTNPADGQTDLSQRLTQMIRDLPPVPRTDHDSDIDPAAGSTANPGVRPPAPVPAPQMAAGRPLAQGDVLFVPDTTGAVVMPHWTQPATYPITLVGEGNGHVMHPDPVVRWAPVYGDPHVIGLVEIPAGYGTARIVQPRGADAHTPLVLGPGVWTVRRQREATTPAAPRRTRRVLD